MFRRNDQNGDGKLSREEFLEMIRRNAQDKTISRFLSTESVLSSPLSPRTSRAHRSMEGPSPQSKSEGPRPQSKSEGPSSKSKSEGPSPQSRSEGPSPQSKDLTEFLGQTFRRTSSSRSSLRAASSQSENLSLSRTSSLSPITRWRSKARSLSANGTRRN